MLDRKFEKASNSSNTVLKSIPNVDFFDFKTSEKNNMDTTVGQQDFMFVHFWATWCAPCEVEFPELVEFLHHFKDSEKFKFVLVAVNDDKKKAKKFLSKFNLDQKNVVLLTDDIDAHKEFGTYKMPETFLFSKSGQLIKKFSGKQPWMQKYLVDYFEKL